VGFNSEELQQWKAGMWSGVDWVGLIEHSTYISGGWIVLNRNHSKAPKVQNIALGVPIEYSALHFLSFHSAMMLIVCPGLEDGTFGVYDSVIPY
jgi:hypothetical protein